MEEENVPALKTHRYNVDASIQRPEDYIEKRGERLITATRNSTNDTRASGMTITWKQKWEEKQLYGRFKWLTSDISHEKTWMWLGKGNLKRETESLRIAAQNNAIRTNHIKARIDKTQQNSRCRFYGEKDDTINHIISGCSKLAQRVYKTSTTGWAMGSTGNCARNLNLTIWTNGICTTLNLSWGMIKTNSSEILRYKRITQSRPDSLYLIIVNKKERTCRIVYFAAPADHRVKLKEWEKRDKYLVLSRELKKNVEHESDDYTNCNWCSWYSH